MKDILYTVSEVTELLKCNENYVRKLVKKGYLPGLHLGRLKIRAAALDDFLAKYEGYDLTDLDNVKKMEVENEPMVG